MQKRHITKLTQLDNIQELGTKYQPLISGNQLTKDIFNAIERYWKRSTEYRVAIDHSVKVFWEEKSVAREDLIVLTNNASKAAISLGRFRGFVLFSTLVKFSITDLREMSDIKLNTHVRMLLNLLIENFDKANEAGITTERIDQLIKAADKLQLLAQKPAKERKNISLIHAKMTKLVSEYTELMITLTAHMEGVYMHTKPEFYKAFVVAKTVKKNSSRKLSLRGRFVDGDGRAVRNVRMSVDGGDEIVKKSRDGGYLIRYLKPGKHVIEFRCAGYITQTHVVGILPNNTTILDICFEPVASAVD